MLMDRRKGHSISRFGNIIQDRLRPSSSDATSRSVRVLDTRSRGRNQLENRGQRAVPYSSRVLATPITNSTVRSRSQEIVGLRYWNEEAEKEHTTIRVREQGGEAVRGSLREHSVLWSTGGEEMLGDRNVEEEHTGRS